MDVDYTNAKNAMCAVGTGKKFFKGSMITMGNKQVKNARYKRMEETKMATKDGCVCLILRTISQERL